MKEIWKKTFNDKYSVSNLGRVRNDVTGLELRPGKVKGYLSVQLSANGKVDRMLVHRLVLLTFNGACGSKLECNHIDGNKKNNVLDNLEWVTHTENMHHAVKVLGIKVPRGSEIGTSKLTEDNVRRIWQLRGTKTKREIGKMFGVSPKTVDGIFCGYRWKHVKPNRPAPLIEKETKQ